ncbi:hypothetical protein FRACYDRAFT_254715 [Fragilariopsis cylindrus CCMP1102]|uniref:Spondin domain-containing protein n=1 Tax=Fragilariopsis cylindrus CCMP1102 TaxID=635003 RepID=A0A1E7EKJ6_9STRA|nr:hypothetical protein FRACYDRAFT_254715 [Fragilariopsis cylindrus CCMP1102]|eukprot:OEU06397.1 hypothetical protein FRACYDRAFT_254715 [Fragilariopsis cylindrus CCMP1102]
MSIFVNGQFNEPPGQRREQTYRILEYEASNINQHYSGLLRYYCTFRGKWSAERHPNDFPSSPSWSAPIIVSHSKNYRMWTGTETVTAGVEYVAEEGYPTVMYNEFDNGGYASLQMVVGERMFNTTDSQHLPPINVTYSHPWLSSMTKITPSPDWFVGFSDLRMISYDTETYYSRIVIQSYVWDSGTDDGQTYLAFDRNEFNETQIRPPDHVVRPDDDFLDGVSPYDQPKYDEHYAEFYATEPPTLDPDDNQNGNWNKNMLWLLVLLLVCCCPCVCMGIYIVNNRKAKKQVDAFSVLEDDEQFLDDNSDSNDQYDDDEYDLGMDIIEYYDEDGNLIPNTYDDNGNLIPFEEFEEDGLTLINYYDKDGNPIEIYFDNNDGSGGGDASGRSSSRSINSTRSSSNSTKSLRSNSSRGGSKTNSSNQIEYYDTNSSQAAADDDDYDSYLDSQRLKQEQQEHSFRSNRSSRSGGGDNSSFRSNRSDSGGGARGRDGGSYRGDNNDSYRSHNRIV